MSYRSKTAHDGFTFSLGGMTTIASFVMPPALTGDRINKAWDERLRKDPGRREVELNQWVSAPRDLQSDCA